MGGHNSFQTELLRIGLLSRLSSAGIGKHHLITGSSIHRYYYISGGSGSGNGNTDTGSRPGVHGGGYPAKELDGTGPRSVPKTGPGYKYYCPGWATGGGERRDDRGGSGGGGRGRGGVGLSTTSHQYKNNQSEWNYQVTAVHFHTNPSLKKILSKRITKERFHFGVDEENDIHLQEKDDCFRPSFSCNQQTRWAKWFQ